LAGGDDGPNELLRARRSGMDFALSMMTGEVGDGAEASTSGFDF
jgi:hypothetical protein